MNKLGKRDYVKAVAEKITETLGDDLKQDGADVKAAEEIIKMMNDYLYFHPMDMDYNEYRKWKKERKKDAPN